MLHKNAVEPTTLELLKTICSQQQLSSFVLGGGTSIALRGGHRFSVDLDFFTNLPYDNSTVYKTISTRWPTAELLFEQNQTMMFIVEGIKVDFVLYPFEWNYPFETIEETRLINLRDIIPMKLQAISNRFSKKDFWDIDFLLNEFTLNEMIGFFKTKFPSIDTGYIVHSLTNFEMAEKGQDPIYIIPRKWEEVKSNLEQKVVTYTNSFL